MKNAYEGEGVWIFAGSCSVDVFNGKYGCANVLFPAVGGPCQGSAEEVNAALRAGIERV